MIDEARAHMFVAAAMIVLTAAIALTALRRVGGAPSARSQATPVSESSAPAARPLAMGQSGGAPVPPAARAAARAYAQRLARRAGARVVAVVADDEPATTELEMSATARRGAVRTTWVLTIAADRGAWTVTAHR
jgi:hypothetical protein